MEDKMGKLVLFKMESPKILRKMRVEKTNWWGTEIALQNYLYLLWRLNPPSRATFARP
jgi:hypothetical protein